MIEHQVIVVIVFCALLLVFGCTGHHEHKIEIGDNQPTYTFLKDGKEELQVNFDEDGDLLSIATLQNGSLQVLHFYKETNGLMAKKNIGENGNIIGREYFFFEKTGILKGQSKYNDTLLSEAILYYDTIGTTKTVLFYNDKGELYEKIEVSRDGESVNSYGKDSIGHSVVPLVPEY